ncbi:OmpA family protein [Variovorax dokdonensis]|uniref:OmpA family protein n=1 Tax=Variovorax dokdonensis TaxID=344883 RepID=A0ABT7N7H3_9BURK|nr:OmpA family protein [Variovorax dokdonensis]MDM0043891.1 OmpA family protein [Variovorax dokdonensis]
MSANQDDEAQTYLVLGLGMGVIALVLLLVVGLAVSRGGPRADAVIANQAVAGAAVPGASSVPDGGGIRTAEGVVRIYFVSGGSELPAGAAEALTPIIEGVGAGKKAQISGFHDTTGNATTNEALALRRAQAVRDLLGTLGVPPAQVVMKKPQSTVGTGGGAQARRVEVQLVD